VPDESTNPPPDASPDQEPDATPDQPPNAEEPAESVTTWAPAVRILAFGGAAAAICACVWLGRAAMAHTGPATEALAMFLGAILLAGAGLVLVAVGILGPAARPKGVDPLEWQAERQGLPTDPEAYQDGGLAVAATAFDLEEAHIVANGLQQAEIPAWVQDESISGWYWHLRVGLHRGGIRVLVPAALLPDAQDIMERQRQEAAGAAGALATEPEDAKDEAAYQLWRSAQRLGFLAAIGFAAPVAFFLALRLLGRIWAERKRIGDLPDLRRAHRLTWLILLTIVPLAVVILVLLGVMMLVR